MTSLSMNSLALMTGAENLKSQIIALADQGEGYKAFLISHSLGKIADSLKKDYQQSAIDYWQENKELPAGYTCKESNRKSYDFAMDPQWQILKASLEAREHILKQSADTDKEVYDGNGELVPKVARKESAIYSFSQK